MNHRFRVNREKIEEDKVKMKTYDLEITVSLRDYPNVEPATEHVTVNLIHPCNDELSERFEKALNATETIYMLGMGLQSVDITWPEDLDLD